ncbi:RNA-guided endonuclease TnpB family protein [Dactylosporangium sp. NPDC049742]|uniref:RNA-guided endonuclease TnpB family protein n=1 Tax=Dactylosporangium sp. NPDC049742 TaxID=3154737 RepID=UPI0034497EDB
MADPPPRRIGAYPRAAETFPVWRASLRGLSRTVKRAFKYRFYPGTEQASELARTFGCVRLVYNMALQARTEAWTLRQGRVNYNATSALLTGWKKTEELSFLNEVSLATGAVGVDAGLDSLLTLSTGEKITNPNHERRDRAALARAQRALARKERDSANRAKARLKVARVHARITDRRRDHLHKLSTRLVRENQTIVIEDLTVRNMLRNHSLARAISDAAWRQFRTMLEYKSDWYGRTLVAVDRWFPSSKLCSTCGAHAERMPLNVRSWTCRCGTAHDRDINAARNILAEGLSVIACGGGVRPQRTNVPMGQSSMKQETQRATAGIPCL